MKLSEYEKIILIWGIDIIVGFTFTQFVFNVYILLVLWIFITFHGIAYMLRTSLPKRKLSPFEWLWSVPIILGLVFSVLEVFNVIHTPYQPQVFWIFLCGILMTLMGIMIQHTEFTYWGFGWIGMAVICFATNAPVLFCGLVLGLPLIYKQVLKFLEWKFTGKQTIYLTDSLGEPSGVI